MNHGTTKQVVPLEPSQACPQQVPLEALYVLSSVPRTRRVTITTLSPARALLQVVKHSFNTVVLEHDRLGTQFALASELVKHVPVKMLHHPRRLASLPDLRRAVLTDLGR